MSSVRSAAGAAEYFAKDNYYTVEGSSEASLWTGAGADALDLSGEVDKDAFEQILRGELPSGDKIGQVANRQAGIDLTFSMPKSASIMAYVAGDARVLAANMSAVRATMSWVEKNLAEGRKDIEGRKVPVRTGNLVYALFQHDTSRALDPQAHIHAVIANLTQMPNGRWQALHNGAIWRANTVIGAIYHAYLRTGLEGLGYVTERAGKYGGFEIAGVPRNVIEAFSQRRATILTKAAELGLVSPQARDGVAVTTRNPKVTVDDRDALRAGWIARSVSLGFDGRGLMLSAQARVVQSGSSMVERGYQLISSAVASGRRSLGDLLRPYDPLVDRMLARAVRTPEAGRAQLAVASAVRILSQREAAFPLTMLTKTALDLGLKGVTAEHVEGRIAALVDRGQLIPELSRRRDGAIDLVTTREALRTETAILSQIHDGRGAGTSIVAAGRVPAMLKAASSEPLKTGQLAAATLIVSSSDRAVIVQGVAGAGKSTMLRAVARIAEGEGFRVTGLAHQNKMVADLREGAGIESRTVASFLHTNARFIDERCGPAFDDARQTFAQTLVVVDESSMISSDDMRSLLAISEALGIGKLALVGDRQQLASIDAGKAFALIQAGGSATARMDENLRQRTEQLRIVAALANRGEPRTALRVLGNDIVEHAEPARHGADLWLSLNADERERTAVFASGRASRATINQRIQNGLRSEGRLRGDGLTITVLERVNLTREELRHAASYRAGQVLEVGGPIAEARLERGRYEVLAVDRHGRVEVANGRQRHRFDPQQLSPTDRRARLHLAETRALTIHEGEQIRWTANDKDRGLHNSAVARVIAITDEGVVIETTGAERHALPPGDPMLARLDLAYCLNMHMAQGITTERAITVMHSQERHLSNQRLFNVGVSRVRDALTLVVDDRAKLERQLDRTTGDKTSALETIGQVAIDRPSPGRPAHEPGRLSGQRTTARGEFLSSDRADDGLGLADTSAPSIPVAERGLGLDL